MPTLLDNGQVKDVFQFDYQTPIYPLPELIEDPVQYSAVPFQDCLIMEQDQYDLLTPDQIETLKEERFADWATLISGCVILGVTKSDKSTPSLFGKTITGSSSGATGTVYAINFLNLYDIYTMMDIVGTFELEEALSVDGDYTDAPVIKQIFGVN